MMIKVETTHGPNRRNARRKVDDDKVEKHLSMSRAWIDLMGLYESTKPEMTKKM